MFVTMMFPVFLGIVVALFFLLPAKWRPFVLLCASYFFCGWIDLRALVVLVLISLFTWKAGMKIENQRKKEDAQRTGQNSGVSGKMGRSKSRGYLVSIICFYAAILCVYKYGTYWLSFMGWEIPQGIITRLVMSVGIPVGIPVGLSFYLFQAIGYLADIYQGKSHAEENFWYLSCFLAFFPKLVSGPIEREGDFLPQFRELEKVKFGDRGRLSTAFTYMLWGYFMKMVVADRLAVTVNQIFDSPESFDSVWLLLGAFFYTMQIYCDFAGYSYIAVGCGKIFGIDLVQNFKAPYCAESITDFWRRWHVSLSAWLRDYLYIPLGGNRRGIVRKCINTMIVFLVCGMWHGAGIHFAVWGLLHGVYSVLDTLCLRAGRKIRGGRVITFIEVALAWIFFRAESMRQAVNYVIGMFTSGIHPEKWPEIVEHLKLNGIEAVVIVVGIAVVWAMDEVYNKKKLHLPVLIQKKGNATRYFIFYLLLIAIFVFGMYGPGYHAEQFIYMQF